VDNRQLTTIDTEAVRRDVARWQQRLYPDTRRQEILHEHD